MASLPLTDGVYMRQNSLAIFARWQHQHGCSSSMADKSGCCISCYEESNNDDTLLVLIDMIEMFVKTCTALNGKSVLINGKCCIFKSVADPGFAKGDGRGGG